MRQDVHRRGQYRRPVHHQHALPGFDLRRWFLPRPLRKMYAMTLPIADFQLPIDLPFVAVRASPRYCS